MNKKLILSQKITALKLVKKLPPGSSGIKTIRFEKKREANKKSFFF